MHKEKFATVVITAAGAIGTFLPWVSVPIAGTLNGTAGDGWITFSLYLGCVGLLCIGDRRKPVNWGQGAALLLGVAASFIGVSKILQILEKAEDMSTDKNPFARSMAGVVQPQIGLFLVAAAGFVAYLTLIAMRLRRPRASIAQTSGSVG